MAMEGSRRGKFAEFMAYHILGAIDRNELVAVMHREGQTNHVRNDHRPARPRPNYPLITGRTRDFHLLLKVSIDEWTFF